jgi:uncharacterized protein YecT (DUF1311 family)
MIKYFLIVCAWVPPIAASAASQENDWPAGSAMQVGGLEVHRRDQAEATLGKLEGQLLQLISTPAGGSSPTPYPGLAAALKAQQLAWRRYVPAECEFSGALTGAFGSWPSTYAVRCEANLMENRVRRTRAAIHCIKAITPEARWPEQNRCLFQLAPLTVPLRP